MVPCKIHYNEDGDALFWFDLVRLPLPKEFHLKTDYLSQMCFSSSRVWEEL